MKLSKLSRAVCVWVMCFLISPVPNVMAADVIISESHKKSMVSTSELLTEMDQKQTEAELREYFQNSQVQAELIKRGVSPDEISTRLATLSPQELQTLSAEVQQAKAGGDILITVLLIVLIIFLIKRI